MSRAEKGVGGNMMIARRQIQTQITQPDVVEYIRHLIDRNPAMHRTELADRPEHVSFDVEFGAAHCSRLIRFPPFLDTALVLHAGAAREDAGRWELTG